MQIVFTHAYKQSMADVVLLSAASTIRITDQPRPAIFMFELSVMQTSELNAGRSAPKLRSQALTRQEKMCHDRR